jgi:hypothetical protein
VEREPVVATLFPSHPFHKVGAVIGVLITKLMQTNLIPFTLKCFLKKIGGAVA